MEGGDAFWAAVAEAIQNKYGSEVNAGGQVVIIPVIDVPGPAHAYVGNFPMPYSGDQSIELAIMNEFMNTPPEEDPSPCDPNDNCCALCATGSCDTSPLWGPLNVEDSAHWSGQRAMVA